MVRNSQTINSKQQQAGFRFTARLESDIVVDGVVLASRGSNAYGVLTNAKQSGRLAGRSELTLTLTDIMIDNQMVPVVTSDVKSVTDNTAGNTLGKTVGAAAIGALFGGKSGAKTGAAVGASAAILTSGESTNIPSGTLLEFRTAAPFSPGVGEPCRKRNTSLLKRSGFSACSQWPVPWMTLSWASGNFCRMISRCLVCT